MFLVKQIFRKMMLLQTQEVGSSSHKSPICVSLVSPEGHHCWTPVGHLSVVTQHRLLQHAGSPGTNGRRSSSLPFCVVIGGAETTETAEMLVDFRKAAQPRSSTEETFGFLPLPKNIRVIKSSIKSVPLSPTATKRVRIRTTGDGGPEEQLPSLT